MTPRKSVKIVDYPINTLVQIAATGGQSGDWWQRVALTGEVQIVGSYHHTIIQVINPDTGELTQLPWRTEWLEVLPQGEQLEEVEALLMAIARARSEYSDSAKEQEQSSLDELDVPSESNFQKQPEPAIIDELPPQSELSESEAVVAAQPVEVVSELTEEELADRQRLELKVERAFYEAGCALRELRDRRLYRSTHRTFEEYCKDRFAFQRRHSYRLIDAAIVVDNLCPIGTHEDLGTNRIQILPTHERQVRDLVGLEPDEQRQVWQEAIEQSSGKVPSGRTVKNIVERLKERDATPPPIPYREGDVVLIRGLGNADLRKFDGQWALAQGINEYTVTVALAGKDVSVKPQFLEEVDPKYWAD